MNRSQSGWTDDYATDLKLLDFGARYYDAFSCRWTALDPMAGKYPAITPYSYCAGNPVNMVDPEGMSWYFNNETGEFYHHIEDGDDNLFGYIF